MSETLIHTIIWSDVIKDVVYSYGSQMTFQEGYVTFENLTFASGKPIKTWRSRTNYQDSRTSPELPLLKPGFNYRLTADLVTEPQHTFSVEIAFYSHQNELLRTEIIRAYEHLFTCPKEAFTYTITLKGAGCDKLLFRHLKLYGLDLPTNISLETRAERAYLQGDIPEELMLFKNLNTII